MATINKAKKAETPNRFKHFKLLLPSFDFCFFETVDFENSIICLETKAFHNITPAITQYQHANTVVLVTFVSGSVR